MKTRLRVRYNKRDGKYSIDYSRIRDRHAVRFNLLRQINATHRLIVMINTALDMSQKIPRSTRLLNLATDQGYKEAADYLRDAGFDYRLRSIDKEYKRLLFGFPTGRTELRQVRLLAVAFGKGQLSKEFFELLGCSHDLMIGIDPVKPEGVILEAFEAGQFDALDRCEDFAFTLIDSQWLGYFYTDFNPTGLD